MTAPIRKEIEKILEDGNERATALESLVRRECIKARIKDLTWSLDPNENQTNMNDPYWLIEQRITELQSELENNKQKGE